VLPAVWGEVGLTEGGRTVWVVAAEEEKKAARAKALEQKRVREELEEQRVEILEEQKRGT